MARSIKMKSSQKVRKSRKQRGGVMRYNDYLRQAKAEINAVGKNFYPSPVQGGIMTKWAKEPIEIPGMGMYIGSYCLWNGKPLMRGFGMLTSFETNENTGLPEFIKKGDWFNNKEHGSFQILYGDGDVVSLVQMKKGLPLLSNTQENRRGEGYLPSQYTYSNGQIYDGDLILTNGRIRPPDDVRTAAARASVAPPPSGYSNFIGEKRDREREVLFAPNIKKSRTIKGYFSSEDVASDYVDSNRHANIVGVKRSRSREVLSAPNIKRPRSRGGNATKKSKTNKRNRTNKHR